MIDKDIFKVTSKENESYQHVNVILVHSTQRDESGELTLKSRAEIESNNKIKMLSPERQIEIITLNESRELSETMKE